MKENNRLHQLRGDGQRKQKNDHLIGSRNVIT